MKKLFQKKIIIPTVVAAALLLAAVAGYFLLIPHFTFTVMDGENSYTLRSLQTNPEDILDKLKLTRTDADVYTTEKQKGGTLITLCRAQQIEIVVKGEKQTVYTQGETVQQLLSRYYIGTKEPWRVSVALDAQTYDGMVIQVDYIEQGPYSSIEEIPFEILYCKDPSLPEGQKEIVISGADGSRESTGEAVYVNGKTESVTVTESSILTKPVNQIVAVGTGEKEGQARQFPLIGEDFLITANGQCLYYSSVDVYNATAYTSWVADVTGTTACGTPARVGAVAVDPKVIPYFTKMYIVSEDGVFDYGVASAEDCGGAIKGKIIDLFFDTLAECYDFGRRDILVYFLTEEPA